MSKNNAELVKILTEEQKYLLMDMTPKQIKLMQKLVDKLEEINKIVARKL